MMTETPTRRRARSLADALSPYHATRVPNGRTSRRRIAVLPWLMLGAKGRRP